MSTNETGGAAAQEEATLQEEATEEVQNVVTRVVSLPLVNSAYDVVSNAYTTTKENHPYIKTVCEMAEQGAKTITSVAYNSAQPILHKLEPQISTANEYACKALDRLEEKMPILQQPSEKVVADARELVSSTITGGKGAVTTRVTGVVDAAKSAVQGSVDQTKAVVTNSVNTVMASRVGQLVSSGADAVLVKSEELVDHYLPMTEEELAQLAVSVEELEVSTVQQQQSYFVRLGSLSCKLRHRAYQHSLAKVRNARQKMQDVLSQLQRTVDLIDIAKQRVQEGQKKLHQLWVDWSQRQPGNVDQDQTEQPEKMEHHALAMTSSLILQLQTACSSFISSIQGLPGSFQERVQQLRQDIERMHDAFTAAGSFHDLSGNVLTQSRKTMANTRLQMDDIVEYLVVNTPLTWMVGPFAPHLVEHAPTPETEAVH